MAAPVIQFKRGLFSNLPGLRAGEPGFTTDKYDLYVGIDSTTNGNKFFGSHRYWTKETATTGSGLNLVEGTNNGTNAITLAAPANLAADYTITWPSAITTNGYLKVASDGTLSWAPNLTSSTLSISGVSTLGQAFATTVQATGIVTASSFSGSGSGLTNNTVPITALDTAGGQSVSSVVGTDTFIVDSGANGTVRKVTAANLSNYILGGSGGATFTNLYASGIGTIAYLQATTANVSAAATVGTDLTVNRNLTVSGGITGQINDTGIGTIAYLQGTNVNASGIVTASSFVPSSGYIKAPDGTNALFIYSSSGNVAFQGTIGASQINNASGNAVINYNGTDARLATNLNVPGIATATTFSGQVNAGVGTVTTLSGTTATFTNITANGSHIGNFSATGVSTAAFLQATTVNATGVVTASSFSGPLTGNVTGNVTGNINASGVSTAAFLQATTVNATGVVTASSFSGSGSGLSNSSVPVPSINITGAGASTSVAAGDVFVFQSAATGLNGKVSAQNLSNYVLGGSGGATFPAINVTGIATVTYAQATTINVSAAATVGTDLTVNRNLSVSGGITGAINDTGIGTVAYLQATTVNVSAAATIPTLSGTTATFTNVTANGGFAGNINATGVSTAAFLQATTVNATGVVTASSFTGSGANLTSLNATQLTTGTVPAARITASSGDFTVGQNLYVTGNVSIGGSTVILNAAQLTVQDKDIVVGYSTDSFGSDISNDTTANHGGVSVASTVGSPLINIPLQSGINSNPSTYKQFMWLKSGNYSGWGTDSWISNYPISIGTTTIQNNSRFTVGLGFTVYDSYLDATDIRARNSYASGISTQTYLQATNVNVSAAGTIPTLSGTTATFTNITANGGFAGNINASGVSTAAFLQATTVNATGVVTASSFTGSGSGLTNSTVPVPALNITGAGASTSVAASDVFVFQSAATGVNGKVSAQNLSNYILGGAGGATFPSINVTGVGTVTYLQATNANVSGVATATTLNATTATFTNATANGGFTGQINDTGIGTVAYLQATNVNVSAAATIPTLSGTTATFTNITANGGLNGNLNATGVSTAAFVQATTVNATGIATAASFRGSDIRTTAGALIPLVGIQSAAAASGIVTAFKFIGTGLDGFTVANNVATISYSGVAATTYTTSQTATATQGQTAFTFSAGYTAGFMDVYLNGIRLITGTDYTATDGGTVNLVSGATAGDEIEMVGWKSLGSVVSVNALTTSGSLQVNGITTSTGGFTGNLNATGVSTATYLQSTNVNASGIVTAGTFSGSGASLTNSTVPIPALNITGAGASTSVAASDVFVFQSAATGVNGKVSAQNLSNYILGGAGGATFPSINVTGVGTITYLQSTNANVSGVATATTLNATTATFTNATANGGYTGNINASGVSTAAYLQATTVNVGSAATIPTLTGTTATFTNITANGGFTGQINDSGIGTVAYLQATNVNVSAAATIPTLSGTTATFTNITANGGYTGNINASGVSTAAYLQATNVNVGAALTVTGAASFLNNLTIAGNLTVNGTTTQVNTQELQVYDRTITLGIQSGTPPTATSWDLGVMMDYGNAGLAQTAGVIYKPSLNRFQFATNASNPSAGITTSAPTVTVASFAPIEAGELWINNSCTGGASQIISCSGSNLVLSNILIDGGTF